MVYRRAKQQKSTLVKKGEADQKWHVVDADGAILGRLATQVATLLMGKHRPEYTSHVDTGDFVVVTNCEKVRVTGRKADQKTYSRYTYHMGGLKVVPYRDLQARKPEMIIREAVRRMLPKSKLGSAMLGKLKIYAGGGHPHSAQQPTAYEVTR